MNLWPLTPVNPGDLGEDRTRKIDSGKTDYVDD